MNETLTGTALNLIEELAGNVPEGSTLSFVTFDFAPSIENRGKLGSADKVAVAAGLHLRETVRLPFWDGVLLAASTGECSASDGLLDAAAFHQIIGSRRVWLPVQEVNVARLNAMCEEAQQCGRMLAVTSAVRLPDGVTKHLPMMDFHLAYSSTATAFLTKLVARWEVPGTLLRSGKSYHFYGRALFDESALTRFLGQTLLFAPIVDRAWIAHQLIEQSCALRISARRDYGGPPTIVAHLG